jgi:chromosome segregation ATPase
MNTPALKLAESDPERSEARANLASAIESRAVDQAAVEHIEGAIQLARESLRSAQAAVREREDGVESAKSDRAALFLSRAKGESPSVEKTSREARAELEAAIEEVEAFESALGTLEQNLRQAQSNLSFSAPKVQRCAEAVIRADERTIAFLRRFQIIEREYQTALAFLDHCPRFHPDDKHAIIGDRSFDAREAIAPWHAWEEALMSDPDATCNL